jgi:hypothetical protein
MSTGFMCLFVTICPTIPGTTFRSTFTGNRLIVDYLVFEIMLLFQRISIFLSPHFWFLNRVTRHCLNFQQRWTLPNTISRSERGRCMRIEAVKKTSHNVTVVPRQRAIGRGKFFWVREVARITLGKPEVDSRVVAFGYSAQSGINSWR